MRVPIRTFALAAGIIATAAWWLLHGRASAPPAAPGAAPLPVVVVEPVTTRAIDDSTEALGTTRAWESIEIRPTVSELVTRLHVGDGATVKAGDLLVTLAQQEEQAHLGEARAFLAEQLREVRRLEGLVQRKLLAGNQLDERRTLLEVARQRVTAAEAALADRTLRAPFDGVLGLRSVSPGTLVDTDTVITTLDDVRTLRLDFPVPATRMAMIAVGAAIVAHTPAQPGAVFAGTVIGIDSRVDPVDRSVIVRARIDNPGSVLKPGLLMNVVLHHQQRTALVVPEAAITHYQREHHVLVVDAAAGNRVADRRIGIGARVPGFAEVRDGLAAGELVVVEGIGGARPGMQVEVRANAAVRAGAP